MDGKSLYHWIISAGTVQITTVMHLPRNNINAPHDISSCEKGNTGTQRKKLLAELRTNKSGGTIAPLMCEGKMA